jgi:hypothetical protein
MVGWDGPVIGPAADTNRLIAAVPIKAALVFMETSLVVSQLYSRCLKGRRSCARSAMEPAVAVELL